MSREGMRIRWGVAIGALFIGGPLADAIQKPLGGGHRALLLVGLAAFLAVYLFVMPPGSWLHARGERWVQGGVGVLALLALGLIAAEAPTSFVGLLVFVAVAAAFTFPPREGGIAVAATAVVAGLVVAAKGGDDGSIASFVLTVFAIGMLMVAFGRVVRVNEQLRQAREELARLAVSEERLRIARDLHDLLGHSLSVIALKAELARRLVERDPARATAELAEIEAVTRSALVDVRAAVTGYRNLALADAVGGARSALADAGIDCDVAAAEVELPAAVDSVLAWAVREGTTNVIRHSGARHCAIRIEADAERAAVEVEDDGATPSPATGVAGNGLAGLRERAQRLRGTVEAGRRPEGGYRLRLTVPLGEP